MGIMLKAIFVDFDGTFIDSLPALWKCYRLFLSHHDIEGEKEEFISLMGPPIQEIVNLLKEKHHLKATTESLVQEYESIVEAAYAANALPFPRAVEILKLQKDAGMAVAIVTSAYPTIVQKVLHCHGIDNLFDAIFGSRQGEPHKPDPAIYRRALHSFGLEPIHAIAIEDSQSGMHSATEAGIPTIAFTPDSQIFEGLPGKSSEILQATSWQEIGHLLNNHRDDLKGHR